MVTIATRAEPVLAAAVTVTGAVPDPLAGLTVTQAAPLDAVQPQVERLAETVTPPVPPAAPIESAFDESASEHGAPACVIV